MSKLVKQDNPCPYISVIVPDEKGRMEIPPKGYDIAVAPLDVKNNLMKLTVVEKYSYKESNGKVHRVGKNGKEYPPMSKEKWEALQKWQEESFKKQEER